MTSRERVAAALAHQEPDRVPYDQSSRSSAIEEQPYRALKDHIGLETPTDCFIRAHATMEEPVRRLLGVDTEFIRHMPKESRRRDGDDALFVDAWQVPWRRRKGDAYFELDGYPFASLDYSEILARRWEPLVSPETAKILRNLAARASVERDTALFCDQIGAGVFERAWYLRGFEQFLMDLMVEKQSVHRYLERILEHQIEGYAVLFDALGDSIMGVLLTDDLATADSLLLSRSLYREMVLPYQKRLIDFIRNRGMKLVFHSCGAVGPLIPDLIDAGVEILHPIQHTAAGMDPAHIKQEYGQDLVLWGGGCDTALLQQGTPREVIDEVNRSIYTLATGGGFVYTTTHCIQPGTPPENILAMAGAIQGKKLEVGDGELLHRNTRSGMDR